MKKRVKPVNTARQYNLSDYNGVRISYGTINYTKPLSVYIELKTYTTPLFDQNVKVYHRIVNMAVRAIKLRLLELNCEYLLKNSIVNFNIPYPKISTDNSSFIGIEITVFPKKMFDIREDKVFAHTIYTIAQQIIDEDLKDKRLFNLKYKKND